MLNFKKQKSNTTFSQKLKWSLLKMHLSTSHDMFGIGLFVCEDETTITLSFNGEVKKMVKAYTKLTKI